MTAKLSDPNPSKPPPRPLSVTLLVLGVLTIAGFNLIRFFQAIQLWDFLSEFPTVSPPYLAVSGFMWGAAGLALAWGLWRGYSRARHFTLIFAVAYSLYYWIDRLWVSSPGLSANLPFSAGLNLILWLVTAWILTRPGARSFFGAMHER
jgi:hypothetical protein